MIIYNNILDNKALAHAVASSLSLSFFLSLAVVIHHHCSSIMVISNIAKDGIKLFDDVFDIDTGIISKNANQLTYTRIRQHPL